jgi:hypothetical protein
MAILSDNPVKKGFNEQTKKCLCIIPNSLNLSRIGRSFCWHDIDILQRKVLTNLLKTSFLS